MKYIINLFSAILISSGLYSQTISYTYDASGNRVKREVIVLDTKKKATEKAPIAQSNEQVQQEPTEVHENKAGSQVVKVYPNPTKGLLLVEISGSKGTSSVVVYDLSGKQVFRENDFGSSGTIDLSRQLIGVYIMKVVAGDKTSEWEIIKQ
jgi:uncharacterized protein YbbK (DUF523 family)